MRYGDRTLNSHSDIVAALLDAAGVTFSERPAPLARVPDGAAVLTIGRDYRVLFDEADAELIEARSWFLKPMGRGSAKCYAVRTIQTPKGPRQLAMHRELLSAPAGLVVDHINGDTLDNRRVNLRLCSQGQNAVNKGHSDLSRRGVVQRGQRWVARTTIGRRTVHVGTFDSAEEAAAAASLARQNRYGSRIPTS